MCWVSFSSFVLRFFFAYIGHDVEVRIEPVNIVVIREKLQQLIQRFRDGATALNLELLPSHTPIQPIIMSSESAALNYSAALDQKGLLVKAIRPPTVPKGTSRLRVTFSAAHEPDDVDTLLSALEDISKDANKPKMLNKSDS